MRAWPIRAQPIRARPMRAGPIMAQPMRARPIRARPIRAHGGPQGDDRRSAGASCQRSDRRSETQFLWAGSSENVGTRLDVNVCIFVYIFDVIWEAHWVLLCWL